MMDIKNIFKIVVKDIFMISLVVMVVFVTINDCYYDIL